MARWRKMRTGLPERIEYNFECDEEGESLRLVMTDEGVIFDRLDRDGTVIATCGGTADEIATEWCH